MPLSLPKKSPTKKSPQKDAPPKKLGHLAVVTGASSGLGAEFARRWAERGYDVALVARRKDRLEALAAELEESSGVHAFVVPDDLSDPEAPYRIVAAAEALGIPIRVLVNCAGFGTAGPFVHEDSRRIADEIIVNTLAPTILSRLLLPALLSAPGGVLLNVSSTASHQPLPGIAVYAATKSYLTSLTESLWQEQRGTGLTVLALCPGPTATGFFEAAGSDAFAVGSVATIDTVVRAAFASLDRPDSGPTLTVGFRNRVTGSLASLAPQRISLAVAARLTSGARG
ncbi:MULTISPECIES: SDR family NAD(P)-dependent oxidoreductase [unclassified Cryobacterium]|uniref:SDR family NAD(P)-dependent oxidoreductase n=1 Tax=unclassified Cryobacterium TaxID=2649013 RepID=UPI001F542603|nr:MULTISPECIES: SDR family NAD(P)-dependent oxidoreductase [unclassified Cryobacterium]